MKIWTLSVLAFLTFVAIVVVTLLPLPSQGAELDELYVNVETARDSVENIVTQTESYKDLGVTAVVRGTVLDLGLGELGLAGQLNSDFVQPFTDVPYEAEVFFRFIDGDDFAAECFVSHSGVIDGADNGQTVGCRAGKGVN